LWAAVTPTHRFTVANILIYLVIALATAAVIALAAGIIKSRTAKREEARENRDKRKNGKSRITTNSKAESHR
jgi:NhaP-type Na+/H+ or K+/H+ antiporter